MQQQLNISLDKTTSIVCDECNEGIFSEGLILRRASKFITGTKQDAIIPIPIFVCTNCRNVNQEFLPKELVKTITTNKD